MNEQRLYRVESQEDFRRLHDVLVEYEDGLALDLKHGPVENAEGLRRQFGDPNAAFVAVCGQVTAGCVAVRRLDDRTALMLRLFVKDAFRGQGVARGLMTTALGFLREGGYSRAVVDTDKDRLHPAYQLCLSLGFRECAPYGPVPYPSAAFLDLEL